MLCLPSANRHVQRDEDWLSRPGDEKGDDQYIGPAQSVVAVDDG